MKKIRLLIFALSLLAANCVEKPTPSEKTAPTMIQQAAEDPHSYARPSEAKVTHIDLKLQIDFSKKILKGSAALGIENNESTKLFLDTHALNIEKVMVGDREVAFQVHEPMPNLGSALEIDIDAYTNKVVVYYSTNPNAAALQWLSPKQTAGGKHPFLFTQSQAILARSWIPLQDSPGIRFTYTAEILVPRQLMALMSAENPQENHPEGIYNFRMEQPIPAYLMALAVGDLAFEALGGRSGVYAEPATLRKAANEFAEVEDMLTAAENLYGPYQWGRYDLLVLPPSFPFGGMENPRLTFATPTILAGDRSLTSLVAHELAHSWSGNLVTNATWNDFWLNEGFTTYFENRIIEEVKGKAFADMLAFISYQDLLAEMEEMNYNDDTRLMLDLAGRDPDEGMTAIAYDKGFLLMKLLEEKAGREQWDRFLRTYFETYAFQTMSTTNFLTYLEEKLFANQPALAEQINIEKWVYGNGLPENAPEIPTNSFDEAENAAVAYVEKGTLPGLRQWAYPQQVHFLRMLPDTLAFQQLQKLDQTYGFTNIGNQEVLFEWLHLSIQNNYKPAFQKLSTFLNTVGRRKFVAPLYKAMVEKPETKEMAFKIYQTAKPSYHYVTAQTVDAILETATLKANE